MLISDWSIRVNFSRTSVESMLGNSSAAVMPQSMTSSVLWPRLATNSHHGKNESESVGNRPAESCDSIAYAGSFPIRSLCGMVATASMLKGIAGKDVQRC